MLKKALNKLIETMEERQTVDNIIRANDVKEVYNAEKVAIGKELKKFEELVHTQVNLGEFAIERAGDIICPGVALEVAFVVVMCKVDPYTVFADHGDELYANLMKVKGNYEGVALKFKKFLSEVWQPTMTEEHVLKEVLVL